MGHVTMDEGAKPDGWNGLWLDAQNGLILRLTAEGRALRLDYDTNPTTLKLCADGVVRGGGVTLARHGDRLVMHRPDENSVVVGRPLMPRDNGDIAAIAGRYWSDDLQATLEIGGHDGAAHAGFDGMPCRGPVARMYPVAPDIWIITTRRSMDASPPGDWTLQIHRQGGTVTGLTLGCWLARNISYRRL